MKQTKIIATVVTACVLGLGGPVFAKAGNGFAGDGHQRAERSAKAERQARREKREAERTGKRGERRQDRAVDKPRKQRRDDGYGRRGDSKAYGRWDRSHGSERRYHAKQRRFDNRIDRRQERQFDRIRHGWRSGEITHREMKRLSKDQRKIRRMERRFGSDGVYTKYERRKMNRAMGRASDRIYRSKHNDRTRDYRRSCIHRW